MNEKNNGPSDTAWGVDLVDPVIVTHQSRLILFARAQPGPVGTLYFMVLDPSAASSGDDWSAWNGWYRYRFPETLAATLPQNTTESATIPQELRLAGMDLLTVSPVAEPVASADASFRVSSDGTFLNIYRQSAAGTLLLNRVGLLSRSEEVDGKSVDRFLLEPAWEVRFRRSGLRDVPLDEIDGESYFDPIGEPFFEPTIEFSRISGLTSGAYDVAAVPTADPEVSIIYVAATNSYGVQLHQVRRSSSSLTDYTETPVAYPLITPTLRAGGKPLVPSASFAPSLVFYAEQEKARALNGDEAELQRSGHLMLVIPVEGSGLSSALAVYDFALDRDGNIAVLPTSAQSLVLVDGTFTDGVFTPDKTAPAYPKPADLPATVQIVDGLLVSSMLLGQVQPHGSPRLYFGDDGLIHLYFGGPPPTPPFDRWSSLDPKLPQALVAQFDARVNRLVLSVPWTMTETEEQPSAAVEFYALQSGCLMEGAEILVTDGSLDPNSPAVDLCNVAINYPSVSGLKNETWRAVPRALGPFMDVLNGEASNDSADPLVLSGAKTFFDYSGTLALARLPLQLPGGVSAGPLPVLTFVASRPDITLASVTVAANGDNQDYTLQFKDTDGAVITIHWLSVPVNVATFNDVFNGAAAPATYSYPTDPDGTPLFGLETDAVGVPAPVIFYSNGTNPKVSSMTIHVTNSASVPGALDVTFSSVPPITGVPAEVEDFILTLQKNPDFKQLGLGITGSTAGGRIRTTPTAIGPIGLAGTAALFDVLNPAIDLTGAKVQPGTYVAGFQGRNPSALAPDAMTGFIATSIRPSAGATAIVHNNPNGATRSISRSLHPQADADPLVSGVWIRPVVQQQCAFTSTDNLGVPVTAKGEMLPTSINLRPQWDWTVEMWVRPSVEQQQRLLTFLDNVTKLPEGAPALAYGVALKSQNVVRAKSYKKNPWPDSSYFQSGTSTKATFIPAGDFTWEFWIRPDKEAALPPASGTAPIGGVIQIGRAGSPLLAVGLTADRLIAIVTLDSNSNTHVYKTTESVPMDEDGSPMWSHVAIVGQQDASTTLWSLTTLLDARVVQSVKGVELQSQPGAFLTIGANTTDDTTLFGSIAQIRLWSIARSAADIRRTWLTSMTGFEPGLLGNWPLNLIESVPTGKFVRNNATTTGSDWDAALSSSTQPLDTQPDSFFLSVLASVAGLPTVEADALLTNDRWNHLALVYQAGGALAMNPADRYQKGAYDWVDCGPAESLGPLGKFAIDAYLQMQPGVQGQLGTIMARWANDDDPDDQSFMYWIDDVGEMHLSITVVVDDSTGKTDTLKAQSTGAALADGKPHHVAVVFNWEQQQNTNPDDPPNVDWTINFYKDNVAVGSGGETIKGIASVIVSTTEGNLTIGSAFVPIAGAEPMAAEDFYYLRGTLGRLRFWTTNASLEALFPESYPRVPQASTPKGLSAWWTFREQAGRITRDLVGGNDGTLSNSGMWSSLAATSTLSFIANGGLVGHVVPAASALAPVSQAQFTLGAPAASPAIAGFSGDVAQLALYDEARSLEMIQDQMFVPRYGNEASLIACWNFSDSGADITGGQNNFSPPVTASRLSASMAPMSNEGPYVRNVYGGIITDLSQSAVGTIAVGSYADAQNIGTVRQRGVLKRQYVVDPSQTLTRAIQIGELDLTYLGQVQTDPSLIGYIEGAPPVPSENLTRPYYLDPGNPSYMIYMGTAEVALVQEAADTMVFSSSSGTKTQIDGGGAIGVFGVRERTALSLGLGFATVTDAFQFRSGFQAVVKTFGEIGSATGEQVNASWSASQRDAMSVNGDWEGFQRDQSKYLNKTVGRRFLVDNAGYALVESLTADLYSLTFRQTKASVGTILLPNPAIPRDRNIIIFPMDGEYTKNGTLDGKVGLVNDPDYPRADAKRGSYFNPIEAYGLAAQIERQQQRAKGVAEQFNPDRKARAWDSSLDDARKAQSQDFSTTPGDPVAVATPVQGLVNRYVWTANGGFHAEEQKTAAASVRSYSANRAGGGGGGFHAAGEFYAKIGWEWSLDLMATHRVEVQVGKQTTSEQALSLNVRVDGDAYLRAFDPEATGDYGGTGAYLPGQAPGKVQGYRFMTFYLPPSTENSQNFSKIIDRTWKRLSNDANARALRQLDANSGTWRVLHRVTYVERIPPPISSRPVFAPANQIVKPANPEGNAELIRLVDAQIPANVQERTRLIVGNAVAATLNPSPTSRDVYPPSALEMIVPWWRTFLDRARPDTNSNVPDAGAAALLQALTGRTTDYMFSGYASNAFEEILANR